MHAYLCGSVNKGGETRKSHLARVFEDGGSGEVNSISCGCGMQSARDGGTSAEWEKGDEGQKWAVG